MMVETAPETKTDEILAKYRRKGLVAELGFGRQPAVLVVDFIIGFTDPVSSLATDLEHDPRLAHREAQHAPT